MLLIHSNDLHATIQTKEQVSVLFLFVYFANYINKISIQEPMYQQLSNRHFGNLKKDYPADIEVTSG